MWTVAITPGTGGCFRQRVPIARSVVRAAAFATTAGLIHFALSERAEIPRRGRALTEESNGLFGRLGNWVREYL